MKQPGQYNFKIVKSSDEAELNRNSTEAENNHNPVSETNNKRDHFEDNAFELGNEHTRKRRSSGKHQMAACCSCKKRRKKCDGKYPICSACEKSDTKCTMIYQPTGKEIKRSYLEELENTVKELQNKVHNNSQIYSDYPSSNSPYSSLTDTESLSQYPPTTNKHKDLAQEVGYITLGAAGEPCYIGETSAYSIAKIIGSSINCFPVYSLEEKLCSRKSSACFFELPFKFPTFEYANELFISYKSSVQCQYPFLDWPFVENCFNIIIKKKKQDPRACFFIFMILAIGSQIKDTSQSTVSSYTKAYYLKAFENVNEVIKHANLFTVQAFLLMAVFSQKMPDGISGWQSVGLAIRTAVVLGLHRKPYHKKSGNLTIEQRSVQDLKSRIFWSAYGIERINGLILGRPFSISDIDIDAPFPLENPETKVACHVVKLRRIQSNICTFIYKPIQLLEKPEDVDSTRVEILLELNDWMSTFPYKDDAISTFETNNWSLISYHNSILLLLRPIILEVAKLRQDSPKRHLEWFKVFTESASAICINYKNMHLKKKLSYTWLAMHCCFVSGISFLYCIWLDGILKILKWKSKSLVYETISSCQTILYILAERWESASIFRDTFERLSNIVKGSIDKERKGNFNNLDDILNTGVFVDGSIEIDSYLTGKNLKDKFSIRDELSGETGGAIIGTPKLQNIEMKNLNPVNNSNIDSLWEFLDTTGDKFLRDLFNEMEDSINLYA